MYQDSVDFYHSICAKLSHFSHYLFLLSEELLPFQEILDFGFFGTATFDYLLLNAAFDFVTDLELDSFKQIGFEALHFACLSLLMLF
jgi:hypothetical protein